MAKNHITSLSITNDTIRNILNSLNLDSNPAIMRLLNDMICSNPNAAKWFVDFALGARFPNNLDPGTEGYIKIDTIRWHTYKSNYDSSGLVQHGFIPCVIKSFEGLHEWNPLVVLLPELEGVPEESRTQSCKIEEFYMGDIHSDIIDPVALPF
jgi:hypothetical protein